MIGILAEKPSQARNFAKALGGMKGTYGGEDYIITNARGHLFEFADPVDQVPSALRPQFLYWDLKYLPWDETQFSWKRKKRPDVASVLKDIKTVMAQCDEVCIATDDDPTGEGELIAWEIFDELNIGRGKKFSRMYFVDESAKEVQKAFKNRKSIPSMMEDMDFIKAQYRSQWDFLSMQFTRIATKCGDGRSVLRQGRLKSAMVLLVGDQLAKVAAYKKVPFYTNRFKDENGNVFTSDKEPMFKTKAEVPQTYTASPVVVDSRAKKSTAPSRLIDLATLSSSLSGKGIRAKTVLSTYQKMYEAQVVSYPRTEDKFITPEQFNDLLPKVDEIACLVGVDPAVLTHRTPRKTHVKTGCAHGANRPGLNVPKSLSSLAQYGPGAEDIYVILAKNYLAMLAEDYEYEQQKGHLEKYPDFTGMANVPLKQGWHAVSYDADDDDDVSTSALGTTAQPFIHEGFPPKPQAPTMKWMMKQLDKHDVGTGATRTSIYADVTNATAKYPLLVETKGKLSMSQYGKMSYMLLPGTHIGDLRMTEQLMNEMRLIAKGEADPAECLHRVQQLVIDDMETMKRNGEKMRKELGVMMDSGEKEKCEGTWNGKDIKFNRTWSGHRFTDEECEKLLAGEEIEIEATSKAGKAFRVRGKLAEQTFNGRKFVGFEKTDFVGGSGGGADDSDYCRGTWNGREIRFKKNFRGHVFTDEECKALLAGESVEVRGLKAKSGGTYGVHGKLAEMEYNGHKYVGYKQEGFLKKEGVPDQWCGHEFTTDEKAALEAGTVVHIDGAVSKKGNVFACDVKYGKKEDDSMGIIPLFDKK